MNMDEHDINMTILGDQTRPGPSLIHDNFPTNFPWTAVGSFDMFAQTRSAENISHWGGEGFGL